MNEVPQSVSCQPSWIYSPYSHRPSHISPVDDLAFAIAQVRIGYKCVAHSIYRSWCSLDPRPKTNHSANCFQHRTELYTCQGTRLYVVSITKVIFNGNIVFKLTYIWCIIIIYLFLTRILKLLSLFADWTPRKLQQWKVQCFIFTCVLTFQEKDSKFHAMNFIVM